MGYDEFAFRRCRDSSDKDALGCVIWSVTCIMDDAGPKLFSTSSLFNVYLNPFKSQYV